MIKDRIFGYSAQQSSCSIQYSDFLEVVALTVSISSKILFQLVLLYSFLIDMINNILTLILNMCILCTEISSH